MQSMLEADEVIDPFKCAGVVFPSVDPVSEGVGEGAMVGIEFICPKADECKVSYDQSGRVTTDEQITLALTQLRKELSGMIDRSCSAKSAARAAKREVLFTPPPGLS
jgi:hypothetical protein